MALYKNIIVLALGDQGGLNENTFGHFFVAPSPVLGSSQVPGLM